MNAQTLSTQLEQLAEWLFFGVAAVAGILTKVSRSGLPFIETRAYMSSSIVTISNRIRAVIGEELAGCCSIANQNEDCDACLFLRVEFSSCRLCLREDILSFAIKKIGVYM